jgi:hypothetical protein
LRQQVCVVKQFRNIGLYFWLDRYKFKANKAAIRAESQFGKGELLEHVCKAPASLEAFDKEKLIEFVNPI